MKKQVSFKRIIALLIVTVLLFSSLHLGLSSFADNTVNSVILNDCSKVGKNTVSYYSSSLYTYSVDKNATEDGHAFRFLLKDGAISAGSSKSVGFSLNANPDGVTPENYKAFSFYADIPASKEGTVRITFRAKEADAFNGTMYAIGQDGSVNIFDDGAAVLNGFKGLLVLILDETAPIKVKYSSYTTDLKTYQEQFGIAKINFFIQNYRYDCSYFVIDNPTAYYDTQSALAAIEEAKRYVPKPIFSYTGTTVFENQEVSLTTDQGNLDIYYTLDGSDPTIESAKYDANNPLKITEDCTVKAVTYRNGNYSAIVSQEYKIYKESDYTTAVLQDGSSKGIVNMSSKQTVTPEITGVSPDGNCVEVKLKAAYSSAIYAKVDPKALTETGLAANDITTVYFWLKNLKGNGDFELTFGSRKGSTLYGFIPGTYYIVDMAKATSEKVIATADYITIPDGFEGYIVFDAPTADKIDNIISDNYVNLAMQYKLTKMQAQDCWYYDNITVSDLDAEFTALSLADECVLAPYVKTLTSYVKQGDKVELFAEDGAEIYYTTDGTEPSVTSAKYDANNPIVINADTTIRAIAIVGGVKSVIAGFEYKVIDPTLPNFTVLNDGSVESDFTNTASANVTVLENISPNGTAYNLLGTATTGNGTIKFNLDTIDTDYMLAHSAFAFWTKIPGDKTVTLTPAFATSTNSYNGNIVTFDTDNGSVTVEEDATSVKLSGFEGYVMFMLGDKATFGDEKWYEVLKEKEFKTFILNIVNSEILNTDIAFDSFGFVLDYDKFVAELTATAIRPDAPYTVISQGLVTEGKNLLLYAGDNTDIYYTLDGTTPTMESTKYVLKTEGFGGEFSPIDILNDFTIKMIAVREGVTSGVSTYTYTVDPEYTGPNAAILNDGSGVEKNTVTYTEKNFDYSVVDDATDDGHAFKLTLKEGSIPKETSINTAFRFALNPDEVVSPMQIKAFSIRLEIPASERGSTNFFFRHAGDGNSFRGKIFAIGDDGTVKQFDKNYAVLNGFKGTVLILIDKVGVNYSSYELSMEDYVKNFDFANKNFTFYLQKYRDDCEYIILDNLTAYYDANKALEAFNIDGLLADYSINTYENANMMVSNDCSGSKVNAGLLGFSDTLTIEKSTVSNDDRNIAATFGKGEGFVEFLNTCKDENAVIANGIVFWVELPKGSGNTAVNLKVNENHQELFSYSSNYHHYQIDVDGVITRVDGDLVLPDGFRGWVVIPKNSTLCLEESPEFVNGRIDFGAVTSTTLEFKNENDALNGKTVYIDDISWYTDFTKLVQSRAYQWAGQVFEN